MSYEDGTTIDRELLNHPRDIHNVFRHTLSSLQDCLTIITETGSIEDAIDYQGDDELNAIMQLMECVDHLHFHYEQELGEE
tara:strand:- start:540 stop:782 length:243 start_codon:yes stop_codon:yes gene_type:complete